ncbi:hypothetical protein KP509_33G033500 [Ceratopteris richardii]|uniref:RRM domain-containing protein n=1 Tax=Ceratopteris richardii TaxID=49495 RepID=A0A8T2QNH7_CERRI|nr:hypothetical protein KP509_33G033500 [Ceratopteris richardii]KAH7285557.1 hypothetical protein KP509_33G033500 [Ceratopteris richardii]
MANNTARPVWIKQAEEAKLKEEQEKSAAAWEAFNSTFKDVNVGAAETQADQKDHGSGSDSEEDEAQILANKPIGPVDPSKCTAAGTGVAGGAAGAAASFVIVTKDSYGRRVPQGGAQIKVKVTPAAGVSGGEVEQEALVKDHGDGTYTVTYVVAKRGNYVVSVDCNGMPILNSPFPVFFSGGSAAVPLTTPASLLPTPFSNGMAPNPYLGGIASMYQTGVPNMQLPLAPSAAAMAAAQAIMAARAYEAAQAREAASASKDSKEDEEKQKELLTRTLQVTNLSPILNVDQVQKLFSFCGTVTECKIDASKQLAYVQYSKPEEAKAALALNNMGVGGRPINVEMARSLPSQKAAAVANGLPVMMQQAVAIQQFQFQQALLMQQAVASQQAALQAATAKTASEMAAARAAEISKSLNIVGNGEPEAKEASGTKSNPPRSKRSRSPSPIRYRPRHRSRSRSRSPIRYQRSRRSRSRSRDRHRYGGDDRSRTWYYRSGDDYYRSHSSRHYRERDREYDQRSTHRRSPSRSKRRASSRSPKSKRERSHSPRSRPEGKNRSRSRSPKQRLEERNRSRSHSPRHRTADKHDNYSHSPRQKVEDKVKNHGHSPRQQAEDKNQSQSCSSPKRSGENISERPWSLHAKDLVRDGHDKRHRDLMEKTSSRSKESTFAFKKLEKVYDDDDVQRTSSPKEFSPVLERDTDVHFVGPEEHDEKAHVELSAKAPVILETPFVSKNDDANMVEVSEVTERVRTDNKERKHHDRKHKRDDDETREKRKRRHKHRSRRSSSDSAEARNKHDREDGSRHRKSSKKKSRHSKSASVSKSEGD